MKRRPYTPTPPITQAAEPFNGTNRHERRKLDAVGRRAERAEFKRADARYVDFGAADATSPEGPSEVERPCVYAKAVHAAKMARRKERGRTGHGGAAARSRRKAKRAQASPPGMQRSDGVE